MNEYEVLTHFKDLMGFTVPKGARLEILPPYGSLTANVVVKERGKPHWVSVVDTLDLNRYCIPLNQLPVGYPCSPLPPPPGQQSQAALRVPTPCPVNQSPLSPPRCECGSDAVKSPYHSAWCPKA